MPIEIIDSVGNIMELEESNPPFFSNTAREVVFCSEIRRGRQ